jgi:hypothetical protein
MNKTTITVVLLIAIALSALLSACGTNNPITAGYQACGDITSCVNNTGPAMDATPCLVGTRGADGNCY